MDKLSPQMPRASTYSIFRGFGAPQFRIVECIVIQNVNLVHILESRLVVPGAHKAG